MRKCDICGHAGVRVRRVTKSYGKGKDLIVIESIPVMRCSHCRESYFTAETLHAIERLKLHREMLAERRMVSVVAFS